MTVEGFSLIMGHLIGDYIVQNDWMAAGKTQRHLPCIVHCLCYMLAVWLCSCWWLGWAWMPMVFLAHYPVDRWRLARSWMVNMSGQEAFATGALSPWSIIVVDNTIHLAVLFWIGLIDSGVFWQ
jgi:hypothetical protein